jgi:hypothetical protein
MSAFYMRGIGTSKSKLHFYSTTYTHVAGSFFSGVCRVTVSLISLLAMSALLRTEVTFFVLPHFLAVVFGTEG